MNYYDDLFDYINDEYNNSNITFEEAEYLNDLLYNTFMESDDNTEEKKNKIDKKKIGKKILKGALVTGAVAGTAYAANKIIKNENSKKNELDQKVLSDLEKKLSDIEKSNKEAKARADELSKTWQYKKAIKEIDSVNKDVEKIKSQINKEYQNSSDKKRIISKADYIISANKPIIKELQKNDTKKQLRRFDNKYWIDYTKKHSQAFKETEKELRGFNTERGKTHDMDKYIMYHMLPAPLAHALHVQFSKHHKKHARTEEDYTQMMIDWECNRKTKPDKQMKPYEVLDKFYPDLKDTMIPILRKYGLPTNAAEDREMSKKKGNADGK